MVKTYKVLETVCFWMISFLGLSVRFEQLVACMYVERAIEFVNDVAEYHRGVTQSDEKLSCSAHFARCNLREILWCGNQLQGTGKRKRCWSRACRLRGFEEDWISFGGCLLSCNSFAWLIILLEHQFQRRWPVYSSVSMASLALLEFTLRVYLAKLLPIIFRGLLLIMERVKCWMYQRCTFQGGVIALVYIFLD